MSKRVLLVEPDEAILVSLEFLLQRAGYTVLIATHPDRVIESVANDAPDVVVVADEQNCFDGYTLCRTLRSIKLAPPVLMLAAKARETDRAKALGVGAADFLAKPFSTRDFLESVARLVTEDAH